VQLLTKDTYRWAVYLVQPEPYTRLRRLSDPYLITIAGDGSDAGGGNDSDNMPDWPDAPDAKK
jgi:hypothetical protein